MTRYVPIVVVVPESAVDMLCNWAEEAPARAMLEPIRDLMARNGWTNEAVLGGAMLNEALIQREDGDQ